MSSAEDRYEENRRWLGNRLALSLGLDTGGTFLADTPTSIDPRTVGIAHGSCSSAPLAKGTRTWAFELEADRDRFVKEYGPLGAVKREKL